LHRDKPETVGLATIYNAFQARQTPVFLHRCARQTKENLIKLNNFVIFH
jgi:hypothetical protein